MKRILTLCALVCLFLAANAKTRNAEWGTPASSGAWNPETATYSWTQSYSNLATVFDCNTDKLYNYTSLHLTTSGYTDAYRVCFMKGSTPLATITFYSAGQKDLIFAERLETKNIDLSAVTHISFGGASGSGSIVVQNVYLEGPDGITLYPQDLRTLATNDNRWANIEYHYCPVKVDLSVFEIIEI